MATDETEQILAQFRTVFRRRKLLILGCVGAVLLPVLIYNQTVSPLYEASTSLVFDEFAGPVPALHSDFSQEILTSNRLQELSSRSLANEIAVLLTPEQRARFHLPKRRPAGFDDMEWIGERIHESLAATAVRKSSLVRLSVRLGDPVLAADVANTAARAYKERSLRVQQEGVHGVRLFVEEQLQRYRGQLDGSEQELRGYKESQNISSFEGQQQEVLRRLTEAEVLYNTATTDRKGMEKRLGTIEESLTKTREELVPSITEVASPRMQALQERLLELQLRYGQLQVQNYAADHPKMVQFSDEIKRTKSALVREAQRVAAGGDLGDPIAQISKYGEERLALQIEIAATRAREQALARVMNDYERNLNRLPEKELRLARITRDRDVNRRIYDSLLEKLEETKISEAENLPGVRIVDGAEPDPVPVRPRKAANLAIGLLLGLMGGTGLAFVRETTGAMDSVTELEAATGWAALASVPRIYHLPPDGTSPADNLAVPLQEVRARKRSLISLLEPGGGPAEAYRVLRTNLKFRGVGERIRTILITSTEPNEGKTTLVSNLALSFATMGDRVLVLDAEVRRPGMHRIFQVPEHPGLNDLLGARPAGMGAPVEEASEVLVFGSRKRPRAVRTLPAPSPEREGQDLALRAAIHRTSIPNLWVLPAGTPPENPGNVLAAHEHALQAILQAVRGEFDVVILDTPPLAVVHDSGLLSRLVDGVVVVVNSRRIDKELLGRSRSFLEGAGAHVLGSVLNQVDPVGVYKKNSYYYYSREAKSGGD